VQDKIQLTRKTRQDGVRIAHLDTGVDSRHEEIQTAIANGKIKQYRGFPNSLEPLEDRNGHGTHGASILLRTAPNAQIYIARVVNDRGQIPEVNYPDVEQVFSIELLY
jgi:subtilisin family serine protease